MRTADRLSYSEVVGAMLGTDALLYIEEGDYATYRHIYLMPPLTEARIPMMRPAGTSSSDQAQARATDIPSSSRAGASRGGSRPFPPTPSIHPHVGWPDMPTELMAWQYGASSPTLIPLEPPMPSDRYAIDPDSPPPSRGILFQNTESDTRITDFVLILTILSLGAFAVTHRTVYAFPVELHLKAIARARVFTAQRLKTYMGK
ncbi:uncharacterized protein LOC114257285 [Camellia sinensis]|uniref:uncharacterized protein LOC114257285 n=1 Tax=Camellia sinensis TaxID=4442 RepID=UPI001036C679|nr:uncharacterized protein LOC114257285 [Camellia sinensis]